MMIIYIFQEAYPYCGRDKKMRSSRCDEKKDGHRKKIKKRIKKKKNCIKSLLKIIYTYFVFFFLLEDNLYNFFLCIIVFGGVNQMIDDNMNKLKFLEIY